MKKWTPNFWLPFLLAVIAFGAVALTLRDPGLTWDESIYFGFSQRYWVFFKELGRAEWHDLPEMTDEARQAFRDVPRPWGAFSPPVTYMFWRAGQAHPPLGPLCYAAGLGLFSPSMDALTAFRLPAAFIFSGLVLATYFFFSWSPGAGEGADPPERRAWVGATAAVSLILMPRVFGDAHFAALDMPAALTWLLTVIAFRNGMRSRRWAIACGLLFGVALLTKINAFFLPLALWPWAAIAHRRKCLPAVLSMLVLGLVVFIAGWPWLWHSPFAHMYEYLADKASRLHIAVYYLGKTYDKVPPPWHYPFALTTVTVPAGLLVAALAGLYVAATRIRRHEFYLLVLLNLVVIYGVAAFPGVPKYDGVRLFLPAFPFIAGLAAVGLDRLWAAGGPWLRPKVAVGAALALVLLYGLVSYHPYELSYYNGLVGGLRGAHRLGFETEYWGDVFNQQLMRKVNELCPEHASVCVLPVDIRVPKLLQLLGHLRADLRFVTEPDSADYVVLLAREGYFSEKEWELYRKGKPVWDLRLRGVPLCMIFRAHSHPH